jgi:hypothetical protein
VLNALAPLPYTESFDTNGEGTRYTATTFDNTASLTGFFGSFARAWRGPLTVKQDTVRIGLSC